MKGSTKIRRLVKERTIAIKLIKRLNTKCQSPEGQSWNEAIIDMQRSALERHWALFQNKQLEIAESPNLTERGRTRNEEVAIRMANVYHNTKERLSAFMNISKPNHNRTIPKVNEIMLPKFNGSYTGWTSWRAQFVSKVLHTELPADSKIDLLTSALIGEAKSCAGESEHRDKDELDRMWRKLEGTYDNPYQIVTAHINAILDIPPMEFCQPDRLRSIIDTIEQELRALNRFDCNTEAWSPLMAVFILRKLDKSTRAAWEMDRDPVAPPSLRDLLPFLERRILAIRNLKANQVPQASQNNQNDIYPPNENRNKRHASDFHNNQAKRSKTDRDRSNHQQSSNSFASNRKVDTCVYCNGNHRTWNCEKLAKLEYTDRLNKIKDMNVCNSCLSNQHSQNECTWKGCKGCDYAKHNRMNCPKYPVMRVNHIQNNRYNYGHKRQGSRNQRSSYHISVENPIPSASMQANQIAMDEQSNHDDGLPIIGTALCRVQQPNTITGNVRVLCDSGSQINLIALECVQKWNLVRKPCKIMISSIGDSRPMKSLGMVDCVLRHRYDLSATMPVRFVIINKLTGVNPQEGFKCPLTSQLCDDKLADPTFSVPGHVDALVGVSTWTSILGDGIVRYSSEGDRFVAQESMLGWVVSGYAKQSQPLTALSYHVVKSDCDLDKQLEQFWYVDNSESHTPRTAEEQRAEDIFMSTHTRGVDGRYVVTIPLKENPMPLGRSRHTAFNRFIGLENRLKKNAEMAAAYKEFMLDYVDSGQLIPAPPSPESPDKSYYIPYHIISKKKFRVVFDASCITSSGASFNDQQLPGEKLQADLCETLLLFRTFRFGLTADIVKMFRQIKVHQDQWDFQRIFFRPAANEPIGEYCITCVIWGFTSAGFNSVRALQQCARDEALRFPAASAATLTNFYMDDFLSGAETLEELKTLHSQMMEMLASAGFELAKWATSNSELAKELVQNELREIELQPNTGILGMMWDPSKDDLYIKINDYPANKDKIFSKRQFISRIAQVYDPTGLFAPVIIAGKMAMQEIWKLNIGWDDLVPNHIMALWSSFHQNVTELVTIPIPRWIAYSREVQMQLHLFSDASKAAYGSCAYLRSVHHNGDVIVRLITSRNKVAPVKPQTVPRLELLGAVMSVNLCKFVQKACKLSDVTVHYWTDSAIVIHWLKKKQQSLKPFVANRTATILSSSDVNDWHHIPGDQNPADLLSRGCAARQLKNCQLWWNGPQWLQEEPNNWPNNMRLNLSEGDMSTDEAESKVRLNAHINIHYEFPVTALMVNDEPLINRASTLNKLIRTTAFVFRFIRRIKENSVKPVKPATFQDVTPVSSVERDNAIKYWSRLVQIECFGLEWKALQNKEEVPSYSKLRQLCPFIDNEHVVHVGGRLAKSNLPLEMKHQIIIHPGSKFCELIIADAHSRTFHGGTQLTMAIIRHKFWVTNLRAAVKKVINKCVICIRFKKDAAKQLMGSLPPARTNQSFPFVASGVDFAGPFEVRKTLAPQMNLRQLAAKAYKSPATIKCWVVVFVCMTTRAVHLDLAHGLSVEAFLEVFARFISRRGQCSQLWSDNGTNFVGSNKELQRVRQEWQNKIPHRELANLGTTWRFNSPAAPHQGGLWEACVKSMKYHLRRVVGQRILAANQLYTVLTQIECCLNSRPLSPLTDDHNDLEALTPGHFLAGRSLLHHPPSEDLINCNDNRLTLWGQQQKITQSFWHRWKDDFLVSLQKRSKWYRPQENIKAGDMVIVLEENLPPTCWALGRIEEVHPGHDGLVRNVTVRTAAGTKERPIQKLCVLPINHS